MSSPSPLASLSGPEACTRTIAYYNSADAGEVISKDIDQLRKNIVIINGLFDKVMRPLQAFDHKHAKSSNSEGALAPQWADFRTRFNKYVDKSRDSAAAASTVMHLYADAVLGKVGDLKCNSQALAAEIKIFQEKVQEHISATDAVRDDFRQISQDIGDFEHKVKLTMNLNSGDEHLTEDMNTAFENIETLKEKITIIPDEDSKQESTYLAMAATLAPRVAKALLTLSPTAAIYALQAVFGPSVQPESAKSTVLRDIGNVAKRIQAIADIWHNFLMKKIEASRTMFVRLTECLDLYFVAPAGKLLHALSFAFLYRETRVFRQAVALDGGRVRFKAGRHRLLNKKLLEQAKHGRYMDKANIEYAMHVVLRKPGIAGTQKLHGDKKPNGLKNERQYERIYNRTDDPHEGITDVLKVWGARCH
ncbi:uncharacterized protein TRAVEDRAFT_50800 [Trametes versicolor FP-101664 SS1]|uniref:uncharacterized protein n=1 Tax=Trametes versicolor (strain FP-101664) TaxID=717944 RepID=UPI000462466A|nr:uncharacterized protein TRAVEDRAFT_50800 [Trametes versicolor FP-101664 SS1]EIW54661.1 hypothetical protein TRAVEDRAFT_50800 [Trametes versicolor FP-101664 SS1]